MGSDHHNRAEQQAQPHNGFHGLADTVRVTRAVIKADDRLGPQGHTPMGHRNNQQITLHNGGAGHQRITQFRPAVPLEHGIEHNQQYAVRGDNEKRRQTERHHLPDDFP